MAYLLPYLPNLTSFAQTVLSIVLLTVYLFIPMCNSVLLFVSHCFALSWPGCSCKWELVLNWHTWLNKGWIDSDPRTKNDACFFCPWYKDSVFANKLASLLTSSALCLFLMSVTLYWNWLTLLLLGHGSRVIWVGRISFKDTPCPEGQPKASQGSTSLFSFNVKTLHKKWGSIGSPTTYGFLL